MMKKQAGVVAVMTALMLLVGLAAVSYLWWDEYEQRLALAEDVEQLETSLKSKQRNLKETSEKLDSEETASFRLNQQLRQLTASVKQLQVQLDESKKTVTRLEGEKAAFQEAKSKLDTSLKKAIAEQEKAISEAVAALKSEQEAEKITLSQALDEATVAASAMEQEKDLEIVEKNKALEALQARYNALNTEFSAQAKANKELQGENQALSARLTTLESDFDKQLKDQASTHQAERERLEADKLALSNELKTLSQSLERSASGPTSSDSVPAANQPDTEPEAVPESVNNEAVVPVVLVEGQMLTK